jgi:cobalt transporter subunit CbtA
VFQRIFLTALIAGAVAGLIAAGVQRIKIIPLIEQAEVYEAAETHGGHAGPGVTEAWEPQAGLERAAYTILADVLAGVGFAFLLTGAIALASLRGYVIDVRRGLLWGAAGFAVFALAPALGLPPLPPGIEAADLVQRQVWWIATAVATALGLGLIVFPRRFFYGVIGVVLLILPYAIGAPEPPEISGKVPPGLVAEFVVASLAAACVFWLLLGAISGWLYQRLGPAPEPQPAPAAASSGGRTL